ncbi:MAG: SDR family oxidoreductase [Rhodospirillaceae bacterium]|jgi:nucleoside-diphosphate-sugar epimerase|nr:SDR family oxidoreductase [Rhodospirillaceae bacterium]
MKLIVTGACGYKGNVLVPKLLNAGHHVTALDIMWFGNDLQDHPNLEVRQFDVREPEDLDLHGYDAIIHLSSVANDPCGDLDPKLTWEVSCLATMRLADKAVRQGVKRFIYASSGSVYGLKDEEHVTEDLELVPLSEYNKTKMVAERVLMSYSEQMKVQIVRPATVCGLSPRMRLDVAVNMLAMQALTKGAITVLGGEQTRPNIHVDDITDLYIFLLDRPDVLGIYNAGFENLSIKTIAEKISEHIPATINIQPSDDPRSYRINSDKILAAGFKPKKSVSNAISEIAEAYRSGALKNEDRFYCLKWMSENVL